MTEYRRHFTIRHLEDGAILLTAGQRMTRLSADEVTELAEALAGPIVERECARLVGVER